MSMTEGDRTTMTVKELASMLKISLGMAYQLVRRKDFPKIRIGKRIIIPYESFMEWLKYQTEGDI